MQVYAAIQAEKSGRVYVIFSDNLEFYWARATPGTDMMGPFIGLNDVFSSMSQREGKTADHWERVFSEFYPDVSQHLLAPYQRRVLTV